MSTKKDRMNERIENHGADLDALFPNAKKHGVELCKALRRLEAEAHKFTTDCCNGVTGLESVGIMAKEAEILLKVQSLLGIKQGEAEKMGLFVNGDARGYALKLDDSFVAGYRSKGGRLHTDWGGFGILAPDLTND